MLSGFQKVEEIASSTYKLGCHEFLNLRNSRVLKTPERLGFLVSLTQLRLSQIDFERIPASIKHLTKLSKLYLDDCKQLQCLPELPSTLQVLIASGCISLNSVASILMQGDREYKTASQEFNFSACLQLDQNSRTKIMGAAHLRIRRMATSLFYQVNSSSLDLDLFKEKNHDNFLYVSHILTLFDAGISWQAIKRSPVVYSWVGSPRVVQL
jgi:hypothetical protein